jgi:hypothetical protein
LSFESRSDYSHGKGGELTENAAGICKMQAVHSSAAVSVNVFEYWRQVPDKGLLLRSLGLAFSQASIAFERPLPIMDKANRDFPVAPHLDVCLGSEGNTVGIEFKFSEAYNGYKHGGLKQAYLNREELWKDFSACGELARALCPSDHSYKYLHPAQLLKHILGLKRAVAKGGKSELIYLWYDVPFDAGYEHRVEVERFGEIVKKDGIGFKSLTYQELILRLAEKQNEHREYINYLTERYL